MTIAEMFLARAEWWHGNGHDKTLEDIFWKDTATLDCQGIEYGFPINVDPEHKMRFPMVQELHTWIDLLMWAIEGGTLDE
jgi:hypothetical protein